MALNYIDVEYSRPTGTPLFLDASIPDGVGPFPAVVLVHGGGWVRGDKQIELQPLFSTLEAAGFAWFSINYRLLRDWTQFGEAIDDVRAAVRFVKSHASQFNVDSKRIGLVGESAGGQLAAMAALNPGSEPLVQAVATFYAPMDLAQIASFSDLVPRELRAAVNGSPFREMLLTRLRQLSPTETVRPGSPPFLLLHGTADQIVPYQQSTVMQKRLLEAGVPCELYTQENAGHGLRWWPGSSYQAALAGWLRRQLC